METITLSNPTHMMSMVDPVAIDVETLRIDSGCLLDKEFIELIRLNLLMVIITNYQSCLFISQLCMWSFDLSHQRHFVDG